MEIKDGRQLAHEKTSCGDKSHNGGTVYMQCATCSKWITAVVLSFMLSAAADAANSCMRQCAAQQQQQDKKVEKGNAASSAKLDVSFCLPNDSVKDDDAAPSGPVYDLVEQMPQFPGGFSALMKFLNENVQYPETARKNGVQGRVVVSCIIETDGRPTNFHVTRSTNPQLDNEALRVVKNMPKWIPGRHNGVAVRVNLNVPVAFRL